MQDFFDKYGLKILIPLPYFSLLFYGFTERIDKGDSVKEAFTVVLNSAPTLTLIYFAALLLIFFIITDFKRY